MVLRLSMSDVIVAIVHVIRSILWLLLYFFTFILIVNFVFFLLSLIRHDLGLVLLLLLLAIHVRLHLIHLVDVHHVLLGIILLHLLVKVLVQLLLRLSSKVFLKLLLLLIIDLLIERSNDVANRLRLRIVLMAASLDNTVSLFAILTFIILIVHQEVQVDQVLTLSILA